jgi:hypothetical protein
VTDFSIDPEERRRRGTSRISRLGDDDGEFDREFWRSVPPDDRLAMVWELVLEHLAWRQPDAGEPRLVKSVCRVIRRGH